VTGPLVCTPLRVEQIALGGGAAGVVRTGQGRRSTGWARACRPDPDRPLLVAGVAGALDPRLRPGELVVATEVRAGNTTVPCPSAPLLAAALRRLGLPTRLGPLVSSPGLVTGPSRERLAGSGALAVDLESAALVAGGGPVAVVRAVVDTPHHPLAAPGTIVRGIRALQALRNAAPAIAEWTAAAGAREVVLAAPRSFCAGVTRAIEVVERALHRHGAPVYVRRQIVHNAHVVADLARRGAVFVEEVEQVPPGSVVVLSAHGVAPAVRAAAAAHDLTVVDATCPLVAKVHAEVRRYAGRGDTVLLIGHAEHEEVVGTVGEAPGTVRVVRDREDAERVVVDDPARVAYAMQTTLDVDEAEAVADVLRDRFPGLRTPRSEDICYATTNRQRAVRAVAAVTDLVLVVGTGNSSNSRRLVEVAERSGTPARLVDDAGCVDLRWLAGVHRIGVSAGASAPPHLVDDLVHSLAGLGPVDVREDHVTDEDVRFSLPLEVN
jgi:4-hydroxy-3-methylbut-2-enyl diphosphate reductase